MTTAPDIFANAPLLLASRASALALAQSEIVRDGLAPLNTEIRGMTTRGDRILDRSLADAGGNSAETSGSTPPRFQQANRPAGSPQSNHVG